MSRRFLRRLLAGLVCCAFSAGAQEPPAPAIGWTRRVTLLGDAAELRRLDGTVVCRSPCGAPVPGGEPLRLFIQNQQVGPDIDLSPAGGDLRLRVEENAHGSAARGGGILLVVVGSLIGVGGLFTNVIRNSDTDNGTDHAGLIVAGAGAALILFGVVALANAHPSRWTIER